MSSPENGSASSSFKDAIAANADLAFVGGSKSSWSASKPGMVASFPALEITKCTEWRYRRKRNAPESVVVSVFPLLTLLWRHRSNQGGKSRPNRSLNSHA